MAGPAILKIQVITDAAKAVSGLRNMGDAASKTSDKANKSLGSMAKTAAKVAGVAALGGVIAVMKTGISEQSDFLAGQAQLANGLKSTGNAANTSVAKMENLASSVQNYSGQTDDSIVASEKLMLTFTGVRNAAGKNNDIFDQSVKITADMAAKMGGDASKYAVQLGKALNDPARGLAKLTKIGVTFSDAQKKQVKSMQAAGDTVGAQKVIMAELNKEFGGSAKAAGATLPGQMARAKRSFEDVSQSVVAGLMPILTALADILTKYVMPAFAAVMGFISQHQTIFLILAVAIGAVVAVIKVWTIVQAILNSTLLSNPLFLVVAGIVALVAVIVILWTRCAAFRAIVMAVFNALKVGVTAFASAFMTAFRAVTSFVTAAGRAIGNAVMAVVRTISTIAKTIFNIWVMPYRLAFNAVVALIRAVGPSIVGAVKAIVTAIGRALGVVYKIITEPFRLAWAGVEAIFNGAKKVLSGIITGIKHGFTAAIDVVKSAWNAFVNVWNGIQIKVPGVKLPFGKSIGGFTIGLPDLPRFATGAYVTGPTLGILGEAGREFVTPEPMLRRLLAQNSGTTIVVNGALDADAVARQIDRLLTQRRRRTSGARQIGTPLTMGAPA